YEDLPPLFITRVRPGSALFATDRGRMRLPAWKFFFRGVDDPALVLGVARPSVFFPPPLRRFGQPGPGSSIEDSATVSAAGTSITISFVGSPAGTNPCDAEYR